MPALTYLGALVEQFAAAIPDLNLSGDEQEEYSTVLLRLQTQVETGEPSEWIVRECLDYLRQVLAARFFQSSLNNSKQSTSQRQRSECPRDSRPFVRIDCD
jgi:hypothetical protein